MPVSYFYEHERGFLPIPFSEEWIFNGIRLQKCFFFQSNKSVRQIRALRPRKQVPKHVTKKASAKAYDQESKCRRFHDSGVKVSYICNDLYCAKRIAMVENLQDLPVRTFVFLTVMREERRSDLTMRLNPDEFNSLIQNGSYMYRQLQNAVSEELRTLRGGESLMVAPLHQALGQKMRRLVINHHAHSAQHIINRLVDRHELSY
ncbi:hypothetical protein ACMD2_18798 [Ananas comosus]|uniref:Uncharacterized protein n=1 Tax=Ananas comosus TaxID=4615 RepID=A0A199VYW2_ANACO|nr:hypothetical protein ACMD2_18798 [Ananas comosus]